MILSELPHPTLLYERVSTILLNEEQDPKHHAKILASITGLHISRVYRWRQEGIRTVPDLQAICRALQIPAQLILEAPIEGTQMVDCVLDLGAEEVQGRAWISMTPHPTDNPAGQVCRQLTDRLWRLEACHRGPRTTAHAAYYVDTHCQSRQAQARIAVCLPGQAAQSANLVRDLSQYFGQVTEYSCGESMLRQLDSHKRLLLQDFERASHRLRQTNSLAHYRAAQFMAEQLLMWQNEPAEDVIAQLAPPPNVLIVHELVADWPSFVIGVRAVTGRYIPAVILCETPAEPCVMEGHYFCTNTLPELFATVRRLV